MTSEIAHGDCLEVMRGMEDASVTAVVTDPPYALSFMGKGWDKVLPPTDVWREALRVLKPGGMLLAFGGTRTYHRLTCSIEDAGFEIRDCIMWVYGSGYPKSMDISKAIDKADGVERPVVGTWKPTGTARVKGGQGSATAGKGSLGAVELRDVLPIPAAGSDRSRPWAGYGTALKPAYEPIVVAMKPLDGTYAANALAHGVAGMNVDATRIGENAGWSYPNGRGGKGCFGSDSLEQNLDLPMHATKGRWPANLAHDGSDEVLDAFPNAPGQQADLKETGRDRPGHGRYGEMPPPKAHAARQDDSKSAARFFYCTKASPKDRGEGNTHPTCKPVELMRWLVRMVKMPSGTLILDPFMGSGTTGIACALEGVDFAGIEREADYIEIAKRRIASCES